MASSTEEVFSFLTDLLNFITSSNNGQFVLQYGKECGMAMMNNECQRGENTNGACCGSCEAHAGSSHEASEGFDLLDSGVYYPAEGSGRIIPCLDASGE